MNGALPECNTCVNRVEAWFCGDCTVAGGTAVGYELDESLIEIGADGVPCINPNLLP